MQILYFLEDIRTPLLDTIMNFITRLGDETVFIAVAIFLYWCVSKKWGSYVLVVSFLSLFINQCMKIICCIPRPWVQNPGFTIVESARARAEGYSFPSGDTANVTAVLGSWARFTERKWLRVVFLILIILVSFSRMYLGVHYPTDVLFSLVVCTLLIFALYPVYACSKDVTRRLRVSFFILAVLSLGFALFVNLHTWSGSIDIDNLTTARKSGYLMVVCALGMNVGFYFDKRYINFSVSASRLAQILKTILGLSLLIIIKYGLKLLLPEALCWNALRYFLVTVFAVCVWPLTFPWFARTFRKKAQEPV